MGEKSYDRNVNESRGISFMIKEIVRLYERDDSIHNLYNRGVFLKRNAFFESNQKEVNVNIILKMVVLLLWWRRL